MSVIDDIDAINDRLKDWIINTTPAPDDVQGKEQMRRAVALHNQLDQLLTRAQLLDLQQQGKALAQLLAKQGAQVTALKNEIEAVADGIKTAQTVVSVAAQAIAV